MAKFQRNFSLIIGPTTTFEGAILDPTVKVVQLPFTVEFSVERNSLAGLNTATFRVYNLNETTRNKVHLAPYQLTLYRRVAMYAGYGSQLSAIFRGSIKQAWTVREGNNMVTTIEAYDGGFAVQNSQTNTQVPEGTSISDILTTVLGNLNPYGVTIGAIGNYNATVARANAFSDYSSNLASTFSNGGFFIDLEKAYCLQDSECIRGTVSEISSASGLLGTPVVEGNYINFDILFEPRLIIGQIVNLQSQTRKEFNGLYKVMNIKHNGTISDAVCGTAVTSAGLWNGRSVLGLGGVTPTLKVIN